MSAPPTIKYRGQLYKRAAADQQKADVPAMLKKLRSPGPAADFARRMERCLEGWLVKYAPIQDPGFGYGPNVQHWLINALLNPQGQFKPTDTTHGFESLLRVWIQADDPADEE